MNSSSTSCEEKSVLNLILLQNCFVFHSDSRWPVNMNLQLSLYVFRRGSGLAKPDKKLWASLRWLLSGKTLHKRTLISCSPGGEEGRGRSEVEVSSSAAFSWDNSAYFSRSEALQQGERTPPLIISLFPPLPVISFYIKLWMCVCFLCWMTIKRNI